MSQFPQCQQKFYSFLRCLKKFQISFIAVTKFSHSLGCHCVYLGLNFSSLTSGPDKRRTFNSGSFPCTRAKGAPSARPSRALRSPSLSATSLPPQEAGTGAVPAGQGAKAGAGASAMRGGRALCSPSPACARRRRRRTRRGAQRRRRTRRGARRRRRGERGPAAPYLLAQPRCGHHRGILV